MPGLKKILLKKGSMRDIVTTLQEKQPENERLNYIPPSIKLALKAKEDILKKCKSLKKYNSEVKFDHIITSLDFNNEKLPLEDKATVRTYKHEGGVIKVDRLDTAKMKSTHMSSFNASKGMSKDTATLTSTDWQSVGQNIQPTNEANPTDPRI